MDCSVDTFGSKYEPRVNRWQVEFCFEAFLFLVTRAERSDLVKETIRPCHRTAVMRLFKEMKMISNRSMEQPNKFYSQNHSFEKRKLR
jgi:hypothetical protein